MKILKVIILTTSLLNITAIYGAVSLIGEQAGANKAVTYLNNRVYVEEFETLVNQPNNITFGPKINETRYFCKSQTAAQNYAPYPPVAAFNDPSLNKVRCFAYTYATKESDGKCYVYDVDSANPPTTKVTTLDVGPWQRQNPFYCGNEAIISYGKIYHTVNQHLKVQIHPSAISISSTALNPTGFTYSIPAIVAPAPFGDMIQFNANLDPNKYNLFFCKSNAAARPASPPYPALPAVTTIGGEAVKNVRCFGATRKDATTLTDGKCVTFDFDFRQDDQSTPLTKIVDKAPLDSADPTVTWNKWTPQPGEYCAIEGGGHITFAVSIDLSNRLKPAGVIIYTNWPINPLLPTYLRYKTSTDTRKIAKGGPKENTDGSLDMTQIEDGWKDSYGKSYRYFCRPIVAASPIDASLGHTVALPAVAGIVNGLAYTVRCFGYTEKTLPTNGQCRVKDVSVYDPPKADVIMEPSVNDLSVTNWTTRHPNYCADAANSVIADQILASFSDKFSPQPPDASTPGIIQRNPIDTTVPRDLKTFSFIKFKPTNAAELTVGPENVGYKYFCKVEAEASTASATTSVTVPKLTPTTPVTQVRCFAYQPASLTTNGVCRVFDSSESSPPNQTYQITDPKWQIQDFSYCSSEGGATVKSEIEVRPFDNTKITPELGDTITPTLAAAVSYSGINLGNAPGGKVFCKKITLGGTTEFVAITTSSGTNAPVRCFAYGANTVSSTGKCFVKDFKQISDLETLTTITPGSQGWVDQSVTTAGDVSYCGMELGVIKLSVNIFNNSSATITTSSELKYISPANKTITLASAAKDSNNKDYNYFCKSEAVASTVIAPVTDVSPLLTTLNPMTKVRCFAFTTASITANGQCRVYELDAANPPTSDLTINSSAWQARPAIYCETQAKIVSPNLPVVAPAFDNGKLTPAAGTTVLPNVTDVIKYDVVNLGSLNLGSAFTNAKFFCKKITDKPGDPTDTYPKLSTTNNAGPIRCFAYTLTNTVAGKCYIKNFQDLSNLNTVTITSDSTGWKEQAAASNAGPSYCGAEGGSGVQADTAALFKDRFNPVVSTTPTVSTTLTYMSPSGISYILNSAGTGYSYFCKTSASAVTATGTYSESLSFNAANPATQIRCFAFSAATPTKSGECRVYDTSTTTPPTTNLPVNAWQPRQASYCIAEGGAAVNSQISPEAFDSNKISPKAIITTQTPASSDFADNAVYTPTPSKGSPINIGGLSGGKVFCKKGMSGTLGTLTLTTGSVVCFTYGTTSTLAAECYAKEFKSLDDLITVTDVKAQSSGWIKLDSTTKETLSYCAKEGGATVQAATAPPFKDRFSVTIFFSYDHFSDIGKTILIRV